MPVVSFAGDLAGPRAGAEVYKTHSSTGPLVLGGVLCITSATWLPVVLIWAAHVGFDRALGYGLKYPTAFGDTHLGRPVGRDHPGQAQH